MIQLKSWLQSSQDPETVSNTVRGAVLSVSGVLIFLAAQLLHVQVGAQDIVQLATELGTLAGALWFLYGLLMKGVVRMGSVRQ